MTFSSHSLKTTFWVVAEYSAYLSLILAGIPRKHNRDNLTRGQVIFPHFFSSADWGVTDGTRSCARFRVIYPFDFWKGAPRKESIRSLKSVSSELSQTVRVWEVSWAAIVGCLRKLIRVITESFLKWWKMQKLIAWSCWDVKNLKVLHATSKHNGLTM